MEIAKILFNNNNIVEDLINEWFEETQEAQDLKEMLEDMEEMR